MRLARAASRQLALTPASQGVTSALTFFARLISARAVPMPWLATPTAKPRARQSVMRNRFNNGVA